jgi:hypothetical protein
MRGHVWWTPDYDVPGGRARFPVDGDVISLSHSEVRLAEVTRGSSETQNLIKLQKEINAGLRNGSVRSFDLRVPPDKGRQLVVARSAVTSLFKIRDWELLVGAMNGNVSPSLAVSLGLHINLVHSSSICTTFDFCLRGRTQWCLLCRSKDM